MEDFNSVPLGRAGTGAAFILGEDPAAQQALSTINYNNALNLQSRRQALLAAKALAQSYQTNFFKAKAGQLFNRELLAKDQQHIEQGIKYRGQKFDIYNPDPNKPEQLAASEQYQNDRHRLLNQHDVAKSIEDQFKQANEEYAKAKPGEYDPESLKAIHDFVTNHTLDDITENGLQMPTLQKAYNKNELIQKVVPTMTGVRQFVKGDQRITENRFMPDATMAQIEQLHTNGAPAVDLKKKTGLSVDEAKQLPSDVNKIRSFVDQEYRGNPEKRAELIQNGITSYQSPAYKQFLDQQTQQLSAKKQLYKDYFQPFIAQARAKAREEHRAVNDFSAEDQRLQEEASARAKRGEARALAKTKKEESPTYYQDLAERMRTGVPGSGEEFGSFFKNNPAFLNKVKIDNSDPTSVKITVPAKYKTVAGKTEKDENGQVIPNSNRVLDEAEHTYSLDSTSPDLYHAGLATIFKKALGESVGAPSKLLTPYGKGKVPGGKQDPNNLPHKTKRAATDYGL